MAGIHALFGSGFAHPERLWLVLFVPVLLLLVARIRQRARTLGVPSLALWRVALLGAATRDLRWLRRLRVVIQWLLLTGVVLLLAGPQHAWQEPGTRDAILIVDCSAATALPGVDGRPLSASVQDEARALVGLLGREQRTGIAFAGDGFRTVLVRGEESEALRVLSDPAPSRGRVNVDAIVQVVRLAGPDVPVFFVSPFAPDEEAEAKLVLLGVYCRKAGTPAVEAGLVRVERSAGDFLKVTVAGAGERTLVLESGGTRLWSGDVRCQRAGNVVDVPLGPACGEIVDLRLEPADASPADDSATLVLPERRKLSILLVSDRDAPHVEAALAASRRVNRGASGKVSVSEALQGGLRADVVILHGTDWKGALPAARVLLLDATLAATPLTIEREQRVPATLQPPRREEHALLDGLALEDLVLSMVPVCSAGEGLEVLLASSAGPLLVRGRSGDAKLLALTLDPEAPGHNLASLPLFPLLIERALAQLVPEPGWPLPPVSGSDEALLLLPGEGRALEAVHGGERLELEPRADERGFIAPPPGLWRSSEGRLISVAALRPLHRGVPLAGSKGVPSLEFLQRTESARPAWCLLLFTLAALDWALWIVILRRSQS